MDPDTAPAGGYSGRSARRRRVPLRAQGTGRLAAAVGAVVAALYVIGVGGVVLLEDHSEVAKLDRGTFTDTFPPLLLSEGLTLPLSAQLPQPVYPDVKSGPDGRPNITAANRAAVATRRYSDLVAVGVQAPLLGAAAALGSAVTGRRRRRLVAVPARRRPR